MEAKVDQNFATRDQESAIMARDQIAMTQQIPLLTSTVGELRRKLDHNTDFAVDTPQQVRNEFQSALATQANSSSSGAINAGGADSSKAPEIDSTWKPKHGRTHDAEPSSITCAYCDGMVLSAIAKHCKDCECYFHPGHLRLHREEWPCPAPIDHNTDVAADARQQVRNEFQSALAT